MKNIPLLRGGGRDIDDTEKPQKQKVELLKTKVFEDAMSMDASLLKLLLKQKELKEAFFTTVDDILVFDKQKFLYFLDSKEFLQDSYTRYKNKIGLSFDNKFISKNADVVLDFPYKDCVLEGGQSNEETQRKEIFFNETIARENIRQMFSPKVLSNAKRYTKDGIEENIEFTDEDNLIVKGNNLIAMTSLLSRYENKVKCIYIDPPYNTGNDGFKYNDNFNHSTWLTFMKNRLEVAKRFLRDDGVIFVQCDDNEQAYLKVLMDEVFGCDNFVNNLVIKMSSSSGVKMAHITSKFPKIKEYILLYKKNDITLNPIRESKNKIDLEYKVFFDVEDSILEKLHTNNLKEDEIIHVRQHLLDNMMTFKEAIQKYNVSEKNQIKFFEENLHKLARTSNSKSIKQLMDQIQLKDKIDIILYKDTYILVKSDYDRSSDDPRVQFVFAKDTYYSPLCDLWLNISTSINYEGGIKFKNAKKPELLIHNVIKATTNEQDIVMDFFMGSGTTCSVAHKMNRKYVGIEQMDYIDTIALERMKNVLKGEQTGISKTVNFKGGGSFVYCSLLENASLLIKEIQDATDENIQSIKEKIFNDKRLIPYLTTEDLKDGEDVFSTLSLEDKKKILFDLVDKNKLYINVSDLDDDTYDISSADKAFTRSFYAK